MVSGRCSLKPIHGIMSNINFGCLKMLTYTEPKPVHNVAPAQRIDAFKGIRSSLLHMP